MNGLPIELFRGVADQLPDPLYVKDREGKYLYCNLAGAEFAGRSIHEIAGQTDAEVFGAIAAYLSAGDGDVLNSGTAYEDQFVIGESGSRRCFRMLKSPYRAGDQHIQGMVVLLRELTEALASNDVLRRLAQIDAQSGSQFFEKLVMTICETTGAEIALVGELQDENHSIVRTVAFCMDGKLVDNCSYPLTGTPCENVMNNDFCHFHRNVQEGFPEDLMLADLNIESYVGITLYASDGRVLGLVALLSRQVLTAPLLVESAPRMVGTRAGAELERRQFEHRQQRMLFELTVLNEVGKLCAPIQSLDLLFTQVTQVIAGRLFPENCGFVILDRIRQFLVPHESFVLTDRNVVKEPISITVGIIGKTARTGAFNGWVMHGQTLTISARTPGLARNSACRFESRARSGAWSISKVRFRTHFLKRTND